MFSIIICVLGITLSLSLLGCDKDDEINEPTPGIPGAPNGATKIPTELRGQWWGLERLANPEGDPDITVPDFIFTEDRIYGTNVSDDEFFVKVTGKKIEAFPVYYPEVGWIVFCDSYTISGGVLTFIGGIFEDDYNSFRQK